MIWAQWFSSRIMNNLVPLWSHTEDMSDPARIINTILKCEPCYDVGLKATDMRTANIYIYMYMFLLAHAIFCMRPDLVMLIDDTSRMQ